MTQVTNVTKNMKNTQNKGYLTLSSRAGGAIGFERPENSINSLSPRFLRTFGNPGEAM